jgi:hypothetical protein
VIKWHATGENVMWFGYLLYGRPVRLHESEIPVWSDLGGRTN